ncbi:Uncharacterised protein [uncultured archaeon]|nr:Uncharacterised protein [uncultured archaeon]
MDKERRKFLKMGLAGLAGLTLITKAPAFAGQFLPGADKDNEIGAHSNPEDYLIQEVPVGACWYTTRKLSNPLGTDEFQDWIITPKELTSTRFSELSNDANGVFFRTKYYPVKIPRQGVILESTVMGPNDIEVQCDGMGRLEANDPRNRIAKPYLRKINGEFYWCVSMMGEKRITPKSLGMRIIPVKGSTVLEDNETRKVSIIGPTYRPRAFSDDEIKGIRAQIASTGSSQLPTYDPAFF